jgi:hypothetical protein
MSVCYTSWKADPLCRAWVIDGHPFHGCCRMQNHTGQHECKCGNRALVPDPLPRRP